MLKCRDVLALGSAYLDGGATAGERLALRMHLMICGHCRRFVRSLRLTRSTVAGLPLAASELQVRKILSLIPPAGQ